MFGREIGSLEKKVTALDRLRVRTNVILLLDNKKLSYFGIIEEQLKGYIAQYNKCCLRCEGSEDTASERSENRHF